MTRRTTSRLTTDFEPRFFCFCGIFRLFAHGDAKSFFDQFQQVIIGCMDWNTAHGDVLAQVLAAFCQGNAKRFGSFDGIAKKKFVKITHPVKQQRFGVCRLDRDKLFHHGCCCCAAFSRVELCCAEHAFCSR